MERRRIAGACGLGHDCRWLSRLRVCRPFLRATIQGYLPSGNKFAIARGGTGSIAHWAPPFVQTRANSRLTGKVRYLTIGRWWRSLTLSGSGQPIETPPYRLQHPWKRLSYSADHSSGCQETLRCRFEFGSDISRPVRGTSFLPQLGGYPTGNSICAP
jgi:hypothetical protein